MKRELKFRAWDGEMFYHVDIEKNLNPMYPEYEPLSSDYLSVFWQLENKEMFTGLKDKNGKEIYEGDVIAPIAYKSIKSYQVQVFFKNGMFCLKSKKPFLPETLPLYSFIDKCKKANTAIEVIGNIYENSDLLS